MILRALGKAGRAVVTAALALIAAACGIFGAVCVFAGYTGGSDSTTPLVLGVLMLAVACAAGSGIRSLWRKDRQP